MKQRTLCLECVIHVAGARHATTTHILPVAGVATITQTTSENWVRWEVQLLYTVAIMVGGIFAMLLMRNRRHERQHDFVD